MKGQFIPLLREVLESRSWALLSINGRRFLDFVMLEHLRHGGKCNGFLLAPRRQLTEYGIGSHYISAAIEEVEAAGLIHCQRGIGRRPSLYSLAWLPLGKPPIMSALSAQNECQTTVTKAVASADQHSQRRKSSSAKQHSPYRSSIPGGQLGSDLEGISLEGTQKNESLSGADVADGAHA